jgi:HK97 gp10 family phage protein
MTVRIKVEGLKEIAEALGDLPKATAKNIMRRVMVKRAEPIAEKARSLVPIEEGHLKASIHVATKLTRRQRKLRRKLHKDDVDVFVGPGADPAAHLQEYGTSHHPAQPFMRPTFDAMKDGFITGIQEDMWAEVKKALTRIEKKRAKAAKAGI